MTGKKNSRIAETLIVVIIVVLASLLLLSNLGNQYLWQDEAETALIARTVLTHGVPMATDGKNSFSQFRGDDMTKSGVSRYHPWFSYYLLAGFFALFGTSNFVCRLPFALFGVATIVLIYFFGKSLMGTRRAGIIAAACLMLTVPFLILTRQCRYYSPELFSCVLGLYAYYGLLSDRKHSPWLLFAAAMLLFHSHFVICGTMLATVLVHTLLWRRDKLRIVVIVCAAVAVLNLPWMVFFSGTLDAIRSHGDPRLPPLAVTLHLFRQILKHVFYVVLLTLIPLIAVTQRLRKGRWQRPDIKAVEKASLLLLFIVMNVVTAVITPTVPWFRVIGPSVPVCVLLIALLVEATAAEVHVAAAVAVLAALAYFSPMSQYLYEITHDYDGPVEGIVKYLNAHAKPTDLVVTTYNDLPLKFYTKLRILGGMTGEDLTSAKKADWIVSGVFPGSAVVRDYLRANVPITEYWIITLDYPDLATENREEPDLHLYRTPEDAPQVWIGQRVAR